MESRRLLLNASYLAFTATPKNKTLEIFGTPAPQPDGSVRHHAFHSYSMKQAIQERFILDVLAHYTPVASYYRLAKTVEDDPEFDARRAQKKLRRYVEGSDHAISLKAEIMVDHFHDQVLAQNKIGSRGAGDGGHQRHRARDPVLPRHPRLPAGAQEPLPGAGRLLRRARAGRSEGDPYDGLESAPVEIGAERPALIADRPLRFREDFLVPLPGGGGQVGRPATTSSC